MLLVEIEKPENQAVAAWFSEVRNWLDNNGSEASVLTRAGRRIDRLIYRVSFEDAARAHRFSVQFARYSPTTRRPAAFERDQLRAMAAAQEMTAHSPLPLAD
jgi:hypothetical protein